jgi:hypothetical protein
MLVGVVAFNALKVIPPSSTNAIGVLLVGYFYQGQLISVLATLPRSLTYRL